MRIQIALAALLAVAAPLHAQDTYRYAGSGFALELPVEIREMKLTASAELSTQSFQMFAGAADGVGVLVFRTWPRAAPKNLDVGALREAQRAGPAAARQAVAQLEADTSAVGRLAFLRMVEDTTLAARRGFLRDARAAFVLGSGWVRLDSATNELVSAERVTLRSRVGLTVAAGEAPLLGLADVSTPRTGVPEMWMVAFAAQEWTPELKTLAARVLDSFRATAPPPAGSQ